MANDMFPNAEIPLSEQIVCVKRELRIRSKCYARWVDSGRMSQYKATNELRAMGAVLQTLEKLHQEGSTGNTA